jgi:hypothetical protein
MIHSILFQTYPPLIFLIRPKSIHHVISLVDYMLQYTSFLRDFVERDLMILH